jgi:hypothetical protein
MKFFQELRQFTNIPPAELSRLPFMKSLEGLFGTSRDLPLFDKTLTIRSEQERSHIH